MVPMIGYASRPSTKRNAQVLLRHGWRCLLSPVAPRLPAGFEGRYALDNGAWTAFQRKESWDEGAFVETLGKYGAGADWVVSPDIVEGGAASLALSKAWLSACLDACRVVLVAVQDGMEAIDVEHLLGPRVGLFVGGSTEWKEQSLGMWGQLAEKSGCWLHVGRVNSQRRIRWCHEVGADSFDGSGAAIFSVKVPGLDGARRQRSLWGAGLKEEEAATA